MSVVSVGQTLFEFIDACDVAEVDPHITRIIAASVGVRRIGPSARSLL